jgi:RNA polymerase sigma-70 factor, ECF subfamily
VTLGGSAIFFHELPSSRDAWFEPEPQKTPQDVEAYRSRPSAIKVERPVGKSMRVNKGRDGAARDSDRKLIAETALGNRAAFNDLYLEYHLRIVRFISRIAPRLERAEEIANDSLWIVWQRAGQFRGESRVSSWIMGIAFRCCMRALRKVSCPRPAAERLSDTSEHTYEPFRDTEMCEWVASALAVLPAEQRLALDLAYRFGHSCEEIARYMNCPVNTVKTRMFYGRKRLKRVLEDLAEPQQREATVGQVSSG